MTPSSLAPRLRRSLAFARHVPLDQLLRRAALIARRAYRDRAGWTPPGGPAPALAPTRPAPIFAPRSGMIDGLAFTFIGRTVTMPGAMDWNAPSLAPRDQLWRMNLHYMEYLEEVDDARLVALVGEWISANPGGRRGAWRDSWNSYALSLRVVVWMQQCARRGLTPPGAIESLAAQLIFLEANLETDIGGNHLIKNIKALIWASAFFQGPDAARWRKLGLDLLARELTAQILTDGVHYERSPSYHCQILADLLECRHALGAETPPALDAALRAMAQACADLAHPDGFVAEFNDSGLHMAYAPGECLDAFARLFGERPEPRAFFAFGAAGYFGRRDEGQYFVADGGRIGPDSLPAHAHGDILSFEWSVAGNRIIVDPGVYEYIAGPRRAASRAAASHNTLSIEGADQADFFGAFRCGRRPNVEVSELKLGQDALILQGSHDGFSPRHIRRFEAGPNALQITDRLASPSDRAASIGFLLHPEVEVAADGAAVRLSRGAAFIIMTSTAEIVIEDAAWWPDMGYERRTKRLRIAMKPGVSEIRNVFTLANAGAQGTRAT